MVHVLQAAQHLEGAAEQETGSTSLTGFRNLKKGSEDCENTDGVSVSVGTFSSE